jgi:hypothetical protein
VACCERDRALVPAQEIELARNAAALVVRQGVEEGQMGRNDVALRRVMATAQLVQARKRSAVERQRQDERGSDLAQNFSVSFASRSCATSISALSRA